MLHTLAHELVHHIRDWSPGKYKILADFLMEQYGKKGVSVDELVHRQIEKAKANGRTLTYAQAHEEVVADSMETMLADGTLIEKLRILSVKDKSIVAKIESFLKNLVAKIRKAYEGLRPDSQEGRIVAEMVDTSEQLHQLFADAIADASENFKNAEVVGSVKNTSSENMFSLRGINENGIEVYETSADVLKLPWKERKSRYLDLMKNEYRGRTAKFERNGHYYYAEFDRKSLSKAIYGEKRSDKKGHDALINVGADGDVFDLVENSRYTGSEVDKKNHPKADYFDYFVKTVQINNTVFDVLADVQKQYGKNGGYVYTIKLTENKSVKASPIREGQEASLKNSGNALTDETRIPQNGTDVNTSISEKGVKYSEQSDIRYSQRGKSLENTESLWYDKHNPLSFDNRAGVNPRSSINWVYKAEIFSQVENKLFHQMISEINQGSEAFEKNSAGEYMLPVENKIVFTDGNYDYPYIREIIEVMTDSGTLFEEIRKVIFDVESGRTGYREAVRFVEVSFGKERIVYFKNNDNRAYGWTDRKRKGTNRRAAIERYKRLQNGRRNDRESNETSLKRSDRAPDALTPRNLLANALEESAANEVEKKKLAEYKENIGKLYEKEQELYEVRKEINGIYTTKGPRDMPRLKQLQKRATELSNNITVYDKKLLRLESTSFLNNVLEREKSKAIKRQKEKDAERLKAQKEKALQKEKEITERYQASRKKAVESRNKTAMRNKIKRVVNELNQYLLHGTKDKHVMDGMKKVVAEALSILDMDTVGADERVERYNQLIAEATDPDVIASLTETRDRIQGQGDKLHEKLMSLKNAPRFKTQLCKFVACK